MNEFGLQDSSSRVPKGPAVDEMAFGLLPQSCPP